MGSGDPTPPVPAAHFQYSRTPRDRLWSLIFALAWVAAIAGGIYAVKHRNPAFIHLDYSDPASCPAHPEAAHALLEALHDKHGGDFSPSQFVQLAGAGQGPTRLHSCCTVACAVALQPAGFAAKPGVWPQPATTCAATCPSTCLHPIGWQAAGWHCPPAWPCCWAWPL